MSAIHLRRLTIVGIMALCGGFVGLCIGVQLREPRAAEGLERLPLPHHVPKYRGGVSLRFAMAHDVIHERFPRHGATYFEERNRRVRKELDELKTQPRVDGKPSHRYWELLDDLGVGLEFLGKHEEAVGLMRDKLKEQVSCGLTGRDLYSSYANLGTFLILWQIQEGFADKRRAKERIVESIRLVRKSVEVKPDAHFGREMWQATLEEFLLAVLDDPELLLKYDMIGDRLDLAIKGQRRAMADGSMWSHGMARDAQHQVEQGEKAPDLKYLRDNITRVGAEEGWLVEVHTEHTKPVAFDEPTLGIIGMWRYGGGANPHFALALGEIMVRVGQRYIAWTAYERAAQMAGALGPGISEKFTEHCRNRQQAIERQLPANEVSDLRPRFNKELAFGQAYQKGYQEYEARAIRDGRSIDDPDFYAAFEKERGPIASPVGEEDQFVVEQRSVRLPRPERVLAAVLVSAGVFAFVCACLLRGFGFGDMRTPTPDENATPDLPY